MFNFLNLKPEAFGLDFSDLSLKIIKLEKKGGGFALASYGEIPLKPGIIKKGEVKDEKLLVKVIQKLINSVKGKKINSKYVVASLPEEKAFLQVIEMPRIPREDVKSAVIYEAENYIPLPIEEVYLDSQIIKPAHNHLPEHSEGWRRTNVLRPDHYDVLIAALPKKTIDPYIKCLKMAGLKPLALEVESLAISRALIKEETTVSPFLIIDLGETRTGFAIFSGHSLRFTLSIPVSAQKFTEAIARSLEIDLNKAEKLKIKYGLERKTKEGKQIFDALIPPLTDLVEQIKRGIDYHNTHSRHEHLSPDEKEIKKVLLCGGGAMLKGLTDFLSQSLNLPVEFGNPWVNISSKGQKEISQLSKEQLVKYTSAIGLALKGVRKNNR